MTNDCKTCPVSTGTHKPAEAVHQIDEPQADALLELAAYRFTVENREARIAELEAELEAIGAGGVEPLRKRAAAPQAVQAAVPDGWKLVPVEPTQAMIDAMPPVEEVGYWAMYEAAIACAPEAPAHPAEGVPAQAESKIGGLLALARNMVRTALDADNKTEVQEIKAAIEAEVNFERGLRAALANTQPAAQGMALDAARWRMAALISRETMTHPDKRKATEVVAAYMHAVHSGLDIQGAIDAALAAQAKQGEQANG